MMLPIMGSPASQFQDRTTVSTAHRISALVSEDLPDIANSSESNLFPLRVDSPASPTELLSHWCGVGPRPNEAIANGLLLHARSLSEPDYPSASLLERQWQLDALEQSKLSTEAIAFARVLLMDHGGLPVDIVRRAVDQLTARGLSIVEQFQAIAQLWGAQCRPIALVTNQLGEKIALMTRQLVTIASAVPQMQITIVANPASWLHLQQTLDSHTLAILHEGLEVSRLAPATTPGEALPGVVAGAKRGPLSYDEKTRSRDGDDVGSALADAESPLVGVTPFGNPDHPSASAKADPTNSDNALLTRARAALVDAQRFSASPCLEAEPPEDAIARSLAEAVLYDALQADPQTANLFQLNADGGFPFGNRSAEIDLFCPSLLIAIEVDGYFHFQDKNAYRRDRDKDWLMQRHGMTVIRFLAEDVIDRLEFVVGRVMEAVENRRDLH